MRWGPDPAQPEVQQKARWELSEKAGGAGVGCREQVKVIHSVGKHPEGRGKPDAMLESPPSPGFCRPLPNWSSSLDSSLIVGKGLFPAWE